jgi:hypothetical protein
MLLLLLELLFSSAKHGKVGAAGAQKGDRWCSLLKIDSTDIPTAAWRPITEMSITKTCQMVGMHY